MSETVTAAAPAAVEQQIAPVAVSEAPVEQREMTVRETMEAAHDAALGPERDETGRFAADKDVAPPEEAAAAERPAPPEGWGDKAKVDWNRLPRSVQDEILTRAQTPPSAPAPDPMLESIRPYRELFEQRGMIPEKAIPDLLRSYQQLIADPHNVLPELAKQMGVEWGAPKGRQPQAQEPAQNEWKSPEVVALEKKLAELEVWKDAQERGAQQARAAAEQRVYQDVNTQIQAFSKDRPDFPLVRGHMAALMQAGQAKNLEDAYEQAIWANPQTRAAKIEAERKGVEAERTAAATKAKASAAVNVRSDTTVNPAPARSVRETMERAYDAMQSA